MNNFNFTMIEGNVGSMDRENDVLVITLITKSGDSTREFRLELTGKQAETWEKYLSVGSRILASGKLDNDGEYAFVACKEINFLRNE